MFYRNCFLMVFLYVIISSYQGTEPSKKPLVHKHWLYVFLAVYILRYHETAMHRKFKSLEKRKISRFPLGLYPHTTNGLYLLNHHCFRFVSLLFV